MNYGLYTDEGNAAAHRQVGFARTWVQQGTKDIPALIQSIQDELEDQGYAEAQDTAVREAIGAALRS